MSGTVKSKQDTIRLLLIVGVGGALGACTRHGVSVILGGGFFPYGTLAVNLTGCFFLAYISKAFTGSGRISGLLLSGLTVGFIGSLTTFSTYTLETVHLFERNGWAALLYVFFSLIGGMMFCWLGYRAVKRKKETE